MADHAPEPCTSWTTKKRHLSVDLAGNPVRGREGKALCRVGGVGVDVFDEVSINRQLGPYRTGKPPIVVADLPECLACVRAKAKLEQA